MTVPRVRTARAEAIKMTSSSDCEVDVIEGRTSLALGGTFSSQTPEGMQICWCVRPLKA